MLLEDVWITLKPALFFVAAFLYVLGMRRIDQMTVKNRILSDNEYLAWMARKANVSEYKIFHHAAKTWHISTSRIDEDFKQYLLYDDPPYYVKDFIRKARREMKNQ